MALERGIRLLDVCCGPGYAAAAAAARGARAIGVDFAPAMVEEAGRRFPEAEFQLGHAEALPFEDASFDAVVCPFGLLHLSEPERGIAEAHRVLKPGGRYAFTVWCGPERSRFFALVLGAVRTHGDIDVPLPPAPPIFRFADPAEAAVALAGAGFGDVAFRELPIVYRAGRAEEIIDMIYQSTVRTAAFLELQAEATRERIHEAIVAGARGCAVGEGCAIPIPAVLGAGRKAG